MRNHLQPTIHPKASKIKNTNRRSEIISPLLAVVVTTLMSGSMMQANAELIDHSNVNQSNQNKQLIKPVESTSIHSNVQQTNNKQAPTDVSIIKLMQVMHIDEQIQSIVDGKQAAINAINIQTQNQSQQLNDKPLNKRQRELQDKIQNVLGQYAKIMNNGIGDKTDIENLTQAYIGAAKTYYTQAEVDAQITFYDSVMGQNILAKQPQITAAFLQQSLPEDTTETESQLRELVPQMKQIVKDVF